MQDRFRWSAAEPARAGDAIEAALKVGHGRLDVYPQSEDGATRCRPGASPPALHCPDCDIDYKDPSPSTFSFNSPIGACETCRGFGRSIGVDYGLVIPDAALSLRDGAIKPWQTESYKECQADLLKFARKRGIPVDTPWRDLERRAARLGDRGRGRMDQERLVRRASDSSPGSRPRRTRCTSACCSRATAPTPNAAPAAARD